MYFGSDDAIRLSEIILAMPEAYIFNELRLLMKRLINDSGSMVTLMLTLQLALLRLNKFTFEVT